MSRIFPLLIALACLTPGCFGAHGIDDDDPDPPRWTECYAALSSASSGDSCDFPDMCGESGCEGVPTRTVSCIAGEVRLIERICSPVMWFDCEEFRDSGWGTTGDWCDESSFGSCGEPLIDCCSTSYRCDGGIVVAEHLCFGYCEEPPPVCEDYAPPPPELPVCRDSGDCPSGGPCAPSGSPTGCGICFDPPVECTDSADCATGEVCLNEEVECSCGGPARVCRPACAAGSCDEGFSCNEAGVCQAISCHEGYVCPVNTRCFDGGPGRPGGVEVHGCQRLTCAGDLDCDCGACVEGWCHSGPGVCLALVPVPG